jgi:outer membrane protein OmpA-like peptidoglycan-associated protein
MISLRGLAAALAAAVVAFATVPAHAQQKTFYLDRIQMSGAPDDGFTVPRPRLYPKTRFYGMAALGYSLNPLRKETVTDDPQALRSVEDPVQHQIITYLTAGAEIAGRLGLSASLPIALFQSGGDPGSLTSQGVGDGFGTNTADFMDLRLEARLPLVHSASGKFHWGVGGAIWLPTGNHFALAGDDGVTGYPYTNLEFDFSKFFLAFTIGPHFRPTSAIDNTAGALFLASDLRWALGGYVPIRDGKYQVGLELWGTTGITSERINGTSPDTESKFFKSKNTDLEWLLQGRMAVDKERRVWAMAGAGTRLMSGYGAPDLRVLVSIGYWFPIKDTNPSAPARQWRAPPQVDQEADRDHDGFPDSIDKCPDIPEDGRPPDPADGCPAGADRDGDGIPDEMDKCPDVPEDKDGVEDEDGCPETDADNDGIPDESDKCPTEPGPASKIAEKNGCPQLTKLQSDGTIQLLEPIQFEFNKSTIKAVSFPILDEVVALMKSRPKIRVGVYGHTDSVGGDEYNLRLSKSRAAACLRYLVDKGGISGGRLESEGYGKTKPVDTNDTPEGRAKNRRVDFKILGGD